MTLPVIFLADYTLGVQIRVLRTCKGWRQIDLSSMAGVTQAEVSAIERDRYVPLSTRRKIVASLGFV